MRRRLGPLVGLILLAAPRTPLLADSGPLDGIDPTIEKIMGEWKVPGLAIAVVKEGDVLLAKGYGYREIEHKKPVTSKTLFAIGSITKSFTVTGLGMLVDEGKLDWDRPVRELLPEFRLRDRAADEGATVRDLVAHRTGLPRHDLLWYGSGLSRRELLDRIGFLELSRPLRTTWQYNNLMYLAAGCAAEKVCGHSWEELTRERILNPLGMNASRFNVSDADSGNDVAFGYGKFKEDVRRVPFYNLEAIGPAGTVSSNVEEMVRYLKFHIDLGKFGDSRLLSERVAREMQTPQMVVADDPAISLHSPSFEELGPMSYGLGFIVSSYRGQRIVWHSGSIDGFSALMSFLPRKKAGVIVLTNLTGNRPVPVCVTRNVLDRLMGLEPIDWASRAKEADKKAKDESDAATTRARGERRAGTSPSHPLIEYSGTYAHPAYGTVSVTLPSDRLVLAWRGASAPLAHRHYDIFDTAVEEDDDVKIPKVAVTFSYDTKGAIDRLAIPLEPRVADIVFSRQQDKPSADIATAAQARFDVVILGGRVVDGTGNPWFAGDVGIRGDRIAAIRPAGRLRGAEARLTIDANGRVVAPGFIDIQGHSREELLTGDGRVIGKITQGVTTEILGEGHSNAPSKEFDGPHGFDAWLRAMEAHGASINFGSFLGSATVRSYVKGMARGTPSPQELEKMRGLVQNAMADGAFGLASALIYPPDNFVGTDDLIALAQAMAPYGGVYFTHMRSEADQLLEGIDEAIRIGREGGVPVEIYHLKAAGKRNWDKAQAAIAKIAAARASGQDVGADMYPYTAGGTGLTACCHRGPKPTASSSRTSRIRARARRSAPRSSTRRRNGKTWAYSPALKQFSC
jgi:CubicO group peptidase (beta-lactamase class C family)